MDATRFDHLARSLSADGSRRGLLQLLGVLPLLGWLTLFLSEEGAAKQRQKRITKGNKGRDNERQKVGAANYKHEHRRRKHRNRKGHRKPNKNCKPESTAKTCNSKCGAVRNNCKKPVDCGSCACDATCQSDGVCSEPCGGIGCCDGETCQQGDSTDACGAGGETCATCSGETPVCFGGACVCGDVCASGCQFASVQEAIDAADSDGTITICAGVYAENISIGKNLTIVGAGQGDDPATNTILQGAGVLYAIDVTAGTVSLKSLRISGTNTIGRNGGGIFNESSLAMTDCTVSGNTTEHDGGGIYNSTDATLEMFACTVSGNTAAQGGGGIANIGTLRLSGCTVSGNTAELSGGGIGVGGGVSSSQATHELTDCTVSRNRAEVGGGIYNLFSTLALLSGTTVTDNDADDGGGIYNQAGTSTCSGGSRVSGNRPNDCVAISGGSCGAC